MKSFYATCVFAFLVTSLWGEPPLPSFPANEKDVSSLLEKRWSLADIEVYCVPKNRFPQGVQNLVTDGDEVWRGALYEKEKHPFDKITWYASKTKSKLKYSLNVRKGDDHWLLEINNEQALYKPLNRKAAKE